MIRNLLAAVLCATAVTWALPLAFADENLIANPGFDELDEATGLPVGWEPTYWSNPHGTVEASGEARNGEYCAAIRGVPRDRITDAGKRNNNLLAQRIEPPVVGARRLQLRAWLRAAEDATGYMSMIAADEDGNQLQYASSVRLSGKDEWTQLVLALATPPDTARLTVYLRNEGEGAVWYDDISLTASDDVLENDHLRVYVEPFVGGRIRSFYSKAQGRDLTFWSGVRPGGFAGDIAPGDEYPGALRDAACEMQILEPRHRVLVTHGPIPAPMDGLVVEKEFSLRPGAPAVDVRLRVRNEADAARTFRLRPQQCLPFGERVVTCPVESGLRVVRPQPGLAKWGLEITGIADGWIGLSESQRETGLLLMFDETVVEKAYLYCNQDLQTVEWYYTPVRIPAGGVWETSYSIAELSGNGPVVAAGDSIAVGLSPLAMGGNSTHEAALYALRGESSARLSATAEGDGELTALERDVIVSPGAASAVKLPWKAGEARGIALSVSAGEEQVAASIAHESLDDSPVMDLPPVERMAEFPAATGFFPYGEYFRGVVGPEAGSTLNQIKRQLRAYRRCYMNTYMVGEHSMLSAFRDDGASPICELVRKHRMRLIPRADMMRRFERDEARRITKELPPPETVTRDVAVERVEQAYSMDLRRRFVGEYGDLIAAYDFADEPQGQYIPLYMMIQRVYREIDPDHPVLVILNLNRTEFLPYMPIYYGDEYPIRNAKTGGRNPWAVSKMVRFCARRTDAPVWVMLQAFGGLEDYTWQLPNKAEQRLTMYETIANGGKGITFHGTCSPPCWRYNAYYFYPAMDSWLVEEPAWEAMREEGQYLAAVGPALLSSRVSDEEVVQIECEQIGGEGDLYRGPAIKAGILARREGGWFAVAVNQDVEENREGRISVNAEAVPAGSRLYDLYGLSEIGVATDARPALELEPGDGQIYFVGTEAQAADVMAKVHRGHYDGELPLYEIEAELARANGCDLTAAAALAGEAAEACERQDFARAHEAIVAARARVADATAGNEALAESLSAIEESHGLLSELAHTYRANFDVVAPPADRDAGTRGEPFENSGDPRMQQYVDQTADAFCRRLLLEDRLYAGEAEGCLAEARQLLADAKRLHAEAVPYVHSKAQ